MFEHRQLKRLDDYFVEMNNRFDRTVYFYRINGFNDEIENFIFKYYEKARLSGVVIEGKIPNPDEKNLSYYQEIMGTNFYFDISFISLSIKKWLPRINDYQRENVSAAIYKSLDTMKKNGKNDNMLKNAYIKFMCWLYYKFERIVGKLGGNDVPKILYEGEISVYELEIISILSNCGCDVVLLQYGGDEKYLKLDSGSKFSDNFVGGKLVDFPNGFCVAKIREEISQKQNKASFLGAKPKLLNCTNAWIKGEGIDDAKTPVLARGDKKDLFYNCFLRINGVWDKLTYLNDLYHFSLEIKNGGRKILIIENEIEKPSIDEINAVSRKSCLKAEQLIADLLANIEYSANLELQKIMRNAFFEIFLEKSAEENMNLNKLTGKAVYIIAWLKRYQKELFYNWNGSDVGCFVYLGGCKNDNEALFLRFLARLPVDVIILVPNLNFRCCLEDKLLYEINYNETLVVEKFPKENSGVGIGTAAYYAERELDDIMYRDSGIYRERQYDKAVSVTLKTMYEEISILWKQEIKYRPNFSVVESVVNIPVIFSKVSGVKNGDVSKYWTSVKELIDDDVFVIKNAPFINSTDENPIKPYVSEFYKNKRLIKDKLKSHRFYQYSFLREETQDFILDKLMLLIENRSIKGTFENGTEYTIISTVLNIKKDIIRKIQNFDFTKKNPKIIYINTTEKIISLEDSILMAFFNLLGFDIVFFVPTGYMCIEKYFNNLIFEEHQLGEYVYDLTVPNFEKVSSDSYSFFRDIFKRGR